MAQKLKELLLTPKKFVRDVNLTLCFAMYIFVLSFLKCIYKNNASWNYASNCILKQSRLHFVCIHNALKPLKANFCGTQMRSHAYLSAAYKLNTYKSGSEPLLLQLNCNNVLQKRDLTKFSLRKGKRKTVKAVLKRFYRLNWGIWIRGKCGRNKKLHTKSANRKRRLRQHVFTNATQSTLLDKMVTSYWRRPKYYVDDPYEPYHQREEFPLTRKKPYSPLN